MNHDPMRHDAIAGKDNNDAIDHVRMMGRRSETAWTIDGQAGALTVPGNTELRTEVTGYITAYWQQANDGHPYYAIQHPGKTARDMCLDYMRERYEDYLADMADTDPTLLRTIISQSPDPVETGTPVAMVMSAFDHMFDKLWPDPSGTTPTSR